LIVGEEAGRADGGVDVATHSARIAGAPTTVFDPSDPWRSRTMADAGTLTMYSTTWCGYCRRLKTQLDREGIEYTEVDIEAHPEAADFVMQVNNGNQTVPTVLFPDGSAATNPSVAEVKARLAAA
jgi:mycoredoxin